MAMKTPAWRRALSGEGETASLNPAFFPARPSCPCLSDPSCHPVWASSSAGPAGLAEPAGAPGSERRSAAAEQAGRPEDLRAGLHERAVNRAAVRGRAELRAAAAA